MLIKAINKIAGICLLLFVVLYFFPAAAQPIPNEQMLNINRFFNEIGNKDKLQPLFQKLINCNEQSCMISVLHLGDSHIKSRYYSRSMEAALNTMFNQAEHVYKINDTTVGRKTYFFNLQEYAFVGTRFQNYYRSAPFQQYLASNQPDLLIISLGTNDAYSGVSISVMNAQMQELIDMVKKVSPNSVLLFTTPPDELKPIYTRDGGSRLQQVREAIIQNCRDNAIPYWNLYYVMGGMGTMSNWKRWGFATADDVHYTGNGYTIFGRLLAEAIFSCYKQVAPF